MKRKKKSPATTLTVKEQQAAQLVVFRPLLSAEEYSQLEGEVQQILIPAIRINPLKTSSGFLQGLIERYGWNLKGIPFCPNGYRVEVNGGEAVSAVLEHKLGMYYIQEAASMLPVELFTSDANENTLTLDLAASPGGKTTHLVARQQDRGLVLANDSSQGRIQALKVVLQHWGATNTAVTRFAGERFGEWFANTFDRVLIDAPCSMQGLRTAESHDTRPVTEKESRALAKRQQALLTSALAALRPGGEVVYSTCTLLPAENEGVVEVVLDRFAGKIELLDAQLQLPKAAPGVQQVGDHLFKSDMSRVIRLWPHRYQTAGFFAAHMRKVDDLGLPSAPPPQHSMEGAGFFELDRAETLRFCDSFGQTSGYDLHAYLQGEQRVLVKRDARMFLFPRLVLERFRELPLQSAGMLLGETDAEGFIPSHEWTLRFGAQCCTWLLQVDEDGFLAFCRGEDLDTVSPSQPGSAIRVITDRTGRVAGRGRLSGNRLKNLSARQLA